LRLKLYLRAHGFAAEFHDYDWRLPVSQLGAGLVERVRAGGAARVAIVAHSMGGLIARAALSLASLGNVERLVFLGTPHGGSFAAAGGVDLLRDGLPTRLPSSWRGDSGASAEVSDAQLRGTHTEKVDWAALTPQARRLYLQNLNEPPRRTPRVVSPPPGPIL